jgi:hypothetical protein
LRGRQKIKVSYRRWNKVRKGQQPRCSGGFQKARKKWVLTYNFQKIPA